MVRIHSLALKKGQILNYREDWICLLKARIELKCNECGYDKYFSALDFHHRNPETKQFNISTKLSLSPCNNINRTMVFDEIKKCYLLCATCHREKHASTGELPIKDILNKSVKATLQFILY